MTHFSDGGGKSRHVRVAANVTNNFFFHFFHTVVLLLQISITTVKHNLIFLLTCRPYKLQGVFKTTYFGQTSDHLQVYKSLIYIGLGCRIINNF